MPHQAGHHGVTPQTTPGSAVAALLLLITVTAVTGCAGGQSAGDRPVTDVDSLVVHLRRAGFRAERADHISQPFFTPQATVVRVNDEEMQVFEYADEQSAANEAARVSASGRSVGTNQVAWIAPPHFFRKRNLIVIYLGSNEQALLTVRGVLGAQFAGS